MTPLEVISEPRRRERLARLGELGESPVGALAELIDISRPALSQHLKVLKDAGMLHEHQQGRQRLYRLNAEGIANARLEIELFLINELDDLETSARDLSTRRVTDG